MIRKLAVSILLISMFPVSGVLGQAPPAKRRPTVGLVLSGGGARGFAHVGVLKVLEANHIPIDYIAGTSMGALIGAMYAMGMTPAEMESLIAKLDWNQLLAAQTAVELLSYRRKQDRLNIPSALTLKGTGTDLKLPNALNSGHAIGLLIDRLTLRYGTDTNFDDLPIPFHAVGTDMLSGDAVTLKSGSLSRSLRATMSIPGVFAPVEMDGKYLSDGGLVNNIPTDVVKAMGADIVLVVNIESQIGGRESLDTLPGILSQTLNVATLDNSRRSLREADFIIAPDLGTYNLRDFSKSKELIELGQKGAAEKVTLLRSIALNDADWAEHLAARNSRELPNTPPVPDLVAVTNVGEQSTEMIRRKLGEKYNGRPLDEAQQELLAMELTELTGTARFESLDYHVGAEQGKKALVIGSTAMDAGKPRPTRLEVGVDVNSIASDAVNFSLLARLTFFDVGKHGSEWRNDIQVGSHWLFASEYYRPLGQTKFFFAPRASYERRGLDLWVNEERIADYSIQTSELAADIGYGFNNRSEIRAGYAFGYQSANRRIGDPLLPNVNGTYSTAGLKWNYDSLDNAVVPTRGILSRNRVNYYFKNAGATGGFTQAESRTSLYHSLSDRTILFGLAGAGATIGDAAPVLRQFTLGGLFRIGGYGYEEFRGSNYLHGGAGFLHSPQRLPTIFGRKIYLGAWYEGGSMFENIDDAAYRQGVSGGAILDTPIGPLFFGGGVNESGRGQFYFSYGRIFR